MAASCFCYHLHPPNEPLQECEQPVLQLCLHPPEHDILPQPA